MLKFIKISNLNQNIIQKCKIKPIVTKCFNFAK